MLSTQPIKNVSQASHYFLGHDNYYTEDQSLAKERSQWWGKGAQTLGLTGSIDSEIFTQLLKGQLTTGQQLGKVEGDIVKHRPGFDLTFSVPKSVSLLALLGDDERIFSAVERATDKAITLIERDLAKARITRNGLTDYQKTGNLVVAKFLHDLSREGDPQLHTHCVVMNMTQRPDGQWRSLASQMGDYGEQAKAAPDGFLEAVRHHKKFYGAIFRAELAYEMTQLGYTPIKTEPGFFEIAGVSPETIKVFSQRRQDIEVYMQENNVSGAKAAALATLKTRNAKQLVDRETLTARWRAKESLYGIHAFEEAQKTVAQSQQPEISSTGTAPFQAFSAEHAIARQAVMDAIAHLSETRVALRENEVIQQALHNTLSEVSVKSVLQAIETIKQSGELISLPVAAEYRGENHFTTHTLLRYEQELLQAATQVHASHKPLVTSDRLNAYLKAHADLSQEQQHALRTLFSSPNQILLLAGTTGSGKTHLLQNLCELAKMGGYQPVLLTPSKAQSLDLKAQLKRTPTDLRSWLQALFDNRQFQTVAGYMHQQEQLSPLEVRLQKKPLLLLEHANLLSSRQLRDVAQLTERLGGRCIPIGDQQSQLAWQAGSPFTQLLQHGVTAAHLRENFRSSPEPLKAAIADTLQNQLQAAFEKVGPRILSIGDKEKRLEVMAEHYVSLPAAERATTCLLMPGKSACDEMNLATRARLKDSGEINGLDKICHVLLPRSMTTVEQRLAKNYAEGQWVQFQADFRSLGVKRGDYRLVTRIDPQRNTVILAHSLASNKARPWNPQQVAIGKVVVFEEKICDIAVGDVLVWRQNNKLHQLHNGGRMTVTALNGERLQLRREDGKSVKLDLNKPESRHFDYGYAFTPLQKYHAHPDTVIAYQSSFSRQSHQRAFYKLLGQAGQQAWIYTEDKSKLLTQLQQHSGDKLTAIDALLRNEVLPQVTQAAEHIQLLEQAVQKAIDRLQQTPTVEGTAQEAVLYALAHLSEREAAFSHKEVLEVALRHALGNVGLDQVEKAVATAEKNGDLLRGMYSKDGTHWTTQTALQMEREIIALAQESRGQMPPLAAADTVNKYLKRNQLSEEQSAVLRGAMAQPDRILLFQGFAGTRKTTLLMHVQALGPPDTNQNLLCLAPTHQAVKELKARGLEGQTVAHFLTQFRAGRLDLPRDRLVIAVDESSMISNRGMHDFLRAVIYLNARGLVIGDTHQYAAIESGKPFDSLQRAGIQTFYLKDITRQKNITLKEAIQATYRKDFAQAFKILEKSIIEIPNEYPGDMDKPSQQGSSVNIEKEPPTEKLGRYRRLEAIGDHYLSKDANGRAQTLVITLGNEDRIEQNAIIREKLAAQGELHSDPLITQVLVARKLTETELTRVGNYQKDDIVRFNLGDKNLGIEKDQYWTVAEIHSQQNVLVLTRGDGERLAWKPHHFSSQDRVGVEVYQAESREIQAGDLIRWTRTDKNLGLLSPELARVEKIQAEMVSVQPVACTDGGMTPQGAPLTLTPTEARFQHWDHAYAITGYSSQGKTIREVIINAESYRPQLTSQPSLLVAITRAVDTLTIYTDNKAALLEAVLKNAGEKRSALEIMGEFPYAGDKTARTPEPTQKTGKRLEQPVQTMPQPQAINPKSQEILLPLDAQRINQMLIADTEAVVERLLGEPKTKDGSQYRYGSNKGSLVVTLTGDKRGLWHDFQSGKGGNLLSLIAEQRGLDPKRDFKQVLREALQVMGATADHLQLKNSSIKAPPTHLAAPKALTPQQQKSLRYARQLARESQSLMGTVAEQYLREHRGIQLTSFPNSLRFHSGVYSKINGQVNPALLVIAKDSAQKIQAVQAIFLDPATGKKAEVKVQKQTFGMPSKGLVQIEKTPTKTGPTFLAEGPETGLSMYAALGGGDVRITLGKSNFGNLEPQQTGKHIVLCLDNDGNNPQTETLTYVVAQKLQALGKTVWVAKPQEVKNDYNDVLLKQGVSKVVQEMEQAIPYQNYREQTPADITLKSAMGKDCPQANPPKVSEMSLTNEAIQKLINSHLARDLLAEFSGKSLQPLKKAAVNHLPDGIEAVEKSPIKPIQKGREPEL